MCVCKMPSARDRTAEVRLFSGTRYLCAWYRRSRRHLCAAGVMMESGSGMVGQKIGTDGTGF